MEKLEIDGLKIILTPTNMTICDSYKIKSLDKMRDILKKVFDQSTIYACDRGIKPLINEWSAHNHLYKLHIMRKHTCSCDFESKSNLFKRIIWAIVGWTPQKITLKIKDLKTKKEIKKQERAYYDYIYNHKNNVYLAFEEMRKCASLEQLYGEDLFDSLLTRVIYHDNSKYSLYEFDAYRKNFFPINQQEKEENKEAFEKAWEHHWKHNSHHWQHRQNKETFDNRDIDQVLDVLENVLDWMAMGYQFNDRPYQYYEKNKDVITLCDTERAFLEWVIYDCIDKKYIEEEKKNGTRK